MDENTQSGVEIVQTVLLSNVILWAGCLVVLVGWIVYRGVRYFLEHKPHN